jgi:hypothetical protein
VLSADRRVRVRAVEEALLLARCDRSSEWRPSICVTSASRRREPFLVMRRSTVLDWLSMRASFASTPSARACVLWSQPRPWRGIPLRPTVSGELRAPALGTVSRSVRSPDARRDLTLRIGLLAHPARRGGVAAHGEARWSLASEVVVVAIEVQVLLSGVFQRVSSDSPASCRSVQRVKQTWIRGATRECTGEANVPGVRELSQPCDPYTAR